MPGWIAGLAVGVGYDIWAVRRQRETLSSAVWRLRDSSYGWALAGLTAGLLWHFFAEGGRHVRSTLS